MAGPEQPGKRIDPTRPSQSAPPTGVGTGAAGSPASGQVPGPSPTPSAYPAGPQGGPASGTGAFPANPTVPGGPVPGGPVPGGPAGGRSARRGIGYTTYAITVLVAVIAILVVIFVVKNDAQVSIWLFGTTRQMSVAGALAASAGGGLIIGLLVGVIPQIRLRRELRQLRRAARG
ncbi:lipopolysaccharide assembly protein LapA domain-containing protein [Frankia sp. Ag45/Mut15]|uniref:Lipopolysaccharide assembly protein LapA domain-containing protein n=1 Tax=Frankia umida TaxID=573489 RepID=A0ABT0JWT5_9ACTN|nr:lipopolysaccharide assembly protein LapA domain-containing protein [Frankia umida]MCK9876016.1 lipopolysaccharide assembly protein LapA domain-containing protein [Frankia umida]